MVQGLKSFTKAARDLLIGIQKIDNANYPEVQTAISISATYFNSVSSITLLVPGQARKKLTAAQGRLGLRLGLADTASCLHHQRRCRIQNAVEHHQRFLRPQDNYKDQCTLSFICHLFKEKCFLCLAFKADPIR